MAVLEKYCIKNCWEVRLSLHVENMCGYGCYYVWLVVLSTLESISMIGLLVVTSKASTQMPMIDNGCLVVLVASTSTTGTTTSSTSVP